jgi:hypothetical protein
MPRNTEAAAKMSVLIVICILFSLIEKLGERIPAEVMASDRTRSMGID